MYHLQGLGVDSLQSYHWVLIYIYQFGFLPGRSSLQQLLIFVDILLQAKEHKAVADVIHLDIRKAFDTVSHHKLLATILVSLAIYWNGFKAIWLIGANVST